MISLKLNPLSLTVKLTENYGVTSRTLEFLNNSSTSKIGTDLKNILLINRSLFTGFLFFPFGISVHI
jgi:hypothetical protein